MSEETVLVKLDGNKQYDAHFEEVVYSDRTYGQYDAGAIYWIEPIDKVIFINQSGDVYEHGTSHQIGVCDSIKAEYEAWCEQQAEYERDYGNGS